MVTARPAPDNLSSPCISDSVFASPARSGFPPRVQPSLSALSPTGGYNLSAVRLQQPAGTGGLTTCSARVEPASLTKLMTAYPTFTALKQKVIRPDQRVVVSPQAKRAEGSRMFIDVGTSVAVEDLLRGMIVQSGNDASIALAEAVGGSEEGFAL